MSVRFQFYPPNWYKIWSWSYAQLDPDPDVGGVRSNFLCIGPLQWHWYSL